MFNKRTYYYYYYYYRQNHMVILNGLRRNNANRGRGEVFIQDNTRRKHEKNADDGDRQLDITVFHSASAFWLDTTPALLIILCCRPSSVTMSCLQSQRDRSNCMYTDYIDVEL